MACKKYKTSIYWFRSLNIVHESERSTILFSKFMYLDSIEIKCSINLAHQTYLFSKITNLKINAHKSSNYIIDNLIICFFSNLQILDLNDCVAKLYLIDFNTIPLLNTLIYYQKYQENHDWEKSINMTNLTKLITNCLCPFYQNNLKLRYLSIVSIFVFQFEHLKHLEYIDLNTPFSTGNKKLTFGQSKLTSLILNLENEDQCCIQIDYPQNIKILNTTNIFINDISDTLTKMTNLKQFIYVDRLNFLNQERNMDLNSLILLEQLSIDSLSGNIILKINELKHLTKLKLNVDRQINKFHLNNLELRCLKIGYNTSVKKILLNVNGNNLTKLHVNAYSNFPRIENFTNLQILKLIDCVNVENIIHCTTLNKLILKNCGGNCDFLLCTRLENIILKHHKGNKLKLRNVKNITIGSRK